MMKFCRTHCDPIGDKVALVDDEDDLLVRLLLLDELEDRLAHGAEGVASVEDVEDNIGGVDDLVELAVDAAGRPLGVNGLEEVGVGLRLEDFDGGSGRSLFGLRGSLVRSVCELGE